MEWSKLGVMNVNEGTYRERVVRAEIRPDRIMSGKQRRVEARFEPRTEVNGKTWVVKNGRRRRLGRWEGGRQGNSHCTQWTYGGRTHE